MTERMENFSEAVDTIGDRIGFDLRLAPVGAGLGGAALGAGMAVAGNLKATEASDMAYDPTVTTDRLESAMRLSETLTGHGLAVTAIGVGVAAVGLWMYVRNSAYRPKV